ncbi:UDP-glucose 6-dehydrogenase [bacterium]|nr:UDP-glucose 6-dehydrogenase [bacterium]
MKILVIGCGYVGLATGTCLAEAGNEVVCIDKNAEKIAGLQKGEMPINEPELKDLVVKNLAAGKLEFGTDIVDAQVVICAVGTPTKEDGQADLSDVFDVAKSVGEAVLGDYIFVMKSTVPVGTTLKCREFLKGNVVSNPEFLRQGAVIRDTMNPDRIVIGTENKEDAEVMKSLYAPFTDEKRPMVFTDVASAELSKYAANAFLSTKISFINEMADLCGATGANVKDVSKVMGLDSRIGPEFLRAGVGYGGGCLGKDNKSLVSQAQKVGINMGIIKAVELKNENQKNIVMEKLTEHFGNLAGYTICILGLSFKPKTDDLRDAPSMEAVKKLLAAGAKIKVYDPVVSLGKENVVKASSLYEAAKDADAVLVMTEWDEFLNIDFDQLKNEMKGDLLIDGRNMFDPALVKKAGLKYIGVGVS